MNQPCLPVSRRRKRDSDKENTELSFENIQSMDATEYLSAVVQQANTMPEFFSAPKVNNNNTQGNNNLPHKDHVPIDGSAASLQYLLSDQTAILPPPSVDHIPRPNCREWVDGTLANFSSLRGYLEECHLNGVGGKQTQRTLVPGMKDSSGWHIFCVGLDEARGNEGSYFDDDEDDTDEKMTKQEDDDNAAEEKLEEKPPTWEDEVPQTGNVPTVELLLQLDQVMIRRVLGHLSYYVENGWSVSSQRTAWLYALLSRLEQPIHRDDVAIMYGLLKTLTKLRSKITKPKEEGKEILARINLLICVIGLYFEQGGGFHNIFSC